MKIYALIVLLFFITFVFASEDKEVSDLPHTPASLTTLPFTFDPEVLCRGKGDKPQVSLRHKVTSLLGEGGNDGVETDIPKAITLLEEASNEEAWARFKLANLHLNKIHPNPSVDRALSLLGEGEESNCDLCICRLGELYMEGKLVDLNLNRAEQLFRKSTFLGSEVGPVQLAKVLIDPRRGELDYINAYITLEKLASKGDNRAKSNLKELVTSCRFYSSFKKSNAAKIHMHLLHEAITLSSSIAKRTIGDILLIEHSDIENAKQWILAAYEGDRHKAGAYLSRLNPGLRYE